MKNLEIILVFVIYLIVMLGIGVYYYKKNENLSDYILGGRTLNSWVAALSSQASDMSGWLLMGLPGFAYLAGMEAIWIALGLAIGTYLNWKFVARKLRRYTEVANDSITLPVYFENRFRDNSKVLRLISAAFILIFFMIYTSSGLVAGGKLFGTVFGLDYTMALTIGAFVIISYTFLGGFLAVCWTDFLQGLIMVLAIVTVPLAATMNIGGPDAVMAGFNQISPDFVNPFTDLMGQPLALFAIVSSLAWGLGYFGQPHILVRFMAISSEDKIPKARRIAISWVVISLAMAVLVGMIGAVALQGQPLSDPESVFMVLIDGLFPSLVGGVLLAAILAAIMSTVDSQMLVTASALTEDMYSLVRKEASEKELLWVSRLSVILVAVLAYVMALDVNNKVLDLVSYAWAGFGATFGPLVLFSLFWKKTTKGGAIAGMLAGGLTVILWKNSSMFGLSGGIFDLYEIVPAFIMASVFIVLVSLLEKPSKDMLEEYERVTNN
ncbi:sodium/proline symporter PutP [Methanococcus voltae]|uniref:Sodium/proline symporter n=1 Tax=Methanococcus voltae PS TaxID=523842 RepID=A0ABT2EXG2_METVO|nr:sodium/proline symporter PutP [Methanococcus voltae]MBP2172763.1 sodium/proline symporter [Methanococcus voltae]MCS3922651.1 sodium/proline symporter [Methanococcus voltae PS]